MTTASELQARVDFIQGRISDNLRKLDADRDVLVTLRREAAMARRNDIAARRAVRAVEAQRDKLQERIEKDRAQLKEVRVRLKTIKARK